MHYRCFLTFDPARQFAASGPPTSATLRRRVLERLEGAENWRERYVPPPGGDPTDADQFVREGYADWWVIGGRWSGELALARLDPERVRAFVAEFGTRYGWWTSARIGAATRRAQCAALFAEWFPAYVGEVPYWRDIHGDADLGAEDDAQPIDAALYAARLAPSEGQGPRVEGGPAHHLKVWDWDGDLVTPAFIGRKWIVVLYYHR